MVRWNYIHAPGPGADFRGWQGSMLSVMKDTLGALPYVFMALVSFSANLH